MTHKFKIGDKVRLIKSLSDLYWYTSESFYITGYSDKKGVLVCEVSIKFNRSENFVLDKHLESAEGFKDKFEMFYDEQI